LHNSNQALKQINLDEEIVESKWKYLGIFSKNEILKVAVPTNVDAWIMKLYKPPEKRNKIGDQDHKIARELYSANLGIPLTSDVFSPSTLGEEEKIERILLRGSIIPDTNCKSKNKPKQR